MLAMVISSAMNVLRSSELRTLLVWPLLLKQLLEMGSTGPAQQPSGKAISNSKSFPSGWMNQLEGIYVLVLTVTISVLKASVSAVLTCTRAILSKFRGYYSSCSSPSVRFSSDAEFLFSDAISRSLKHALNLVSELPITSDKYSFVRSLAEKILAENSATSPALAEINKKALVWSFGRTSILLSEALQNSSLPSSSSSSSSSPSSAWKVGGGLGLAIRTLLRVETWAMGKSAAEASSSAIAMTERAEKLASELVWLMNSMSECDGALEDTAALWSRDSRLSTTVLSIATGIGTGTVHNQTGNYGARLRVERSVVQVTTRLWRAVGCGALPASREVRFGLIAVWLPVVCKSSVSAGAAAGAIASHEGPFYVEAIDRKEMEESLVRALLTLPEGDQEFVFRLWLQEFACSPFDRPNLSKAYEIWRCKARQAAVAATETSAAAVDQPATGVSASRLSLATD